MKKSMGTKQALKLNFAVFFFSIAEAPGDPAAGAVAVGGERRPPRGNEGAGEGLHGAVQGERQARGQ